MSLIQASEYRLKSVFPPGLYVPSVAGQTVPNHSTHSPEQLYILLVDSYSPLTPSEQIIVNSVWYCKQTASPGHEFLLIQVDDASVEEKNGKILTNYLVLGRNVLHKPTKFMRKFTPSRTSVQGERTADSFKVSCDGDAQRLLRDLNLHPYKFLEHLQFPSDNPLHLYELVTLAYVVSVQHPHYQSVRSNTYRFAGMIWDSLRYLCPAAAHVELLGDEKTKAGWLRYTLDESQVQAVCGVAIQRISDAKLKIANQKEQFERLICERLTTTSKV